MSLSAARLGLSFTCCLVFASNLLWAQTFDQVGERSQGMGGAFVAVADDASAIYWNPAGLANIWKFDAQIDSTGLTHTTADPDQRRSTFVGAAMPAFGLAYYRVRTAVSASGSRQNEGSGEVPPTALTTQNFGVTVLQTIVNRLVIGSTMRAVRGQARDGAPSRTAFDVDAGAMLSVGNVRVGMAAHNLRQLEFQVGDGLDPVSMNRQVRVGLALVPRALPSGVYGPFSLAFDADLTRTASMSGERREAALGAEWWWGGGMVGARTGVRWSTLHEAKAAISGGLTVRLPHSLFAEGHVTKGGDSEASAWGIGARITF